MKKILIANRGEIALRIMRSAKEMGLTTVAVFSEVDRHAPHVRYADEAYCIGPAPSAESYLKGDSIIEVALACSADGIHPGYGFLSENAVFARKVKQAGIAFIGPDAAAMEIMGSKLAAKAAARAQQVPLVPGTEAAVSDVAEAQAAAQNIGFPILIKASAGGGGKGMRIVEKAEDFVQALEMAQSEAAKAFGDASVFIERYVNKPRHIEIQIMADGHGNVCYLFERECSIQRRHQKVIEEAPSSVLSETLRAEMGACAVRLAKACGYVGAGTVEFLIDDQHRFYFLEMNTRLQVEHPVTEMITGIDLVKEQIRVAMGEKLSFTQQDLKISGHAIEVRVYAEDPENNFLPDIGKLLRYQEPSGNGVRVDSGVEQGMEIPIYYDPMLAKLVAYGENRQAAIAKMIRAIDDYQIAGVKTTLSFCRFALLHPYFVSGNFDTHFVARHFSPEILKKQEIFEEAEVLAALAVAAKALDEGLSSAAVVSTAREQISPWRSARLR